MAFKAFDKLEEKLKQLATKFQADLKLALKKAKHVDTGDLSKSIKIGFKVVGTTLEFDITGLEYLQYLDNGDFLQDFLKVKRKELVKIVTTQLKKDIADTIKKKIKRKQ